MTQNIKIDYSKLRPVSKQLPFATSRTVMAMILREMSTTYGRTPGGYLWAILEPVGGIAVMSIFFSAFMRSPPLGTNFLIFYASGVLPFAMFNTISGKMAQTVMYSRQLLAYPRVTIIDALLARFILNFLTQLIVSAIILTGILLSYETGTVLHVPQIILAFAMAGSLGLGVGIMNCFLTMRISVWSNIWKVVTQPLMLVSGVLFQYAAIPLPYRDYIWYNPLIQVTGMMRSAFYLNYDASYVSLTYVFGVSLILIVTGLLFLQRYYRDLQE